MPKVKRGTKRVNRKFVADKETKSKDTTSKDTTSLIDYINKIDGNVFSNINIQPDLLTQPKELPDDFDKKSVISAGGKDWDIRSKITTNSFKGLGIKKKDKQKIKKASFINQIRQKEELIQEQKNTKVREQTEITGDLKPLQEALTTLELLQKTTSVQDKEPTKKKQPRLSEKKRLKKALNDVKVFNQIRKNVQFKRKPGDTIKEHLKNKLKLEAAEEERAKRYAN